NLSMLKNLIKNKNIPYAAIPLSIAVFIFLGILIFNFSGITNLVSNNFYNYISQDIQDGKVAGEYSVRIAQVANVVINANNVRQRIDGFGSAQNHSNAWINSSEPVRSELLDLAFSINNGIGLSIFRVEIVTSLQPSPGVWNWDSDRNQVNIMKEAKKRGVKTFIACPWSPPPWMKTNNERSNGGYLKAEHYQDYANYLSLFVREYKSRFGLDIYAVSIQNEPGVYPYQSCEWSSAQLRTFLKDYLAPTFKKDNVSSKIGTAENGSWNESANIWFGDTDIASLIDIVASHGYGGGTHWFPNAKALGKPVWQTEISYFGGKLTTIEGGMIVAKNIHDHMTISETNAWLWWMIFGTNKTYYEILVDYKSDTGEYIAFKKLYCIGNYSRFIRPGYYRIDSTTEPESGVYTSAYKGPDSELVIVAINDNSSSRSVDFSITGGNFGSSAIPYVTSETKNLEKMSDITVSGNNFSAALPAKSVTTFTLNSPDLPPLIEADSNCPCSSWTNDVCGGGACSATQMRQTRTCPDDCSFESQCISDSQCSSTPPPPSTTCQDLNGHICSQNQTCPSAFISAANSSRCCSQNCVNPTNTCSSQSGSTCSSSQFCDIDYLICSDNNTCCPNNHCKSITADLNCSDNDNRVNFKDLVVLVAYWGNFNKQEYEQTAFYNDCGNTDEHIPDMNGDGEVGLADFTSFLSQWGK
ncbi:MAG: glycoside hydrolase, partial [Candidatus Kuenenbacteria bacterium]